MVIKIIDFYVMCVYRLDNLYWFRILYDVYIGGFWVFIRI